MARILVVDDDEPFRRTVELGLARYQHEVMGASDGNDALRRLGQAAVDIVLTDVVMPGKEGIEFILDLRHLVPRPKIIAMSGGGRVGNASYLSIARSCGADATLAKPFSPEQLIEVVDRLLSL